MLYSAFKMKSKESLSLFEQVDVNHDGKISYGEFLLPWIKTAKSDPVKEVRQDVFYLTMHSTFFILQLFGRKERNALFNDALNTFGIGHMVKDHSDNEREKPVAATT